MTDNTSGLKEKAKIYELFAAIFAKEPTIELLRLFQLKENRELFKTYGIDPLSGIRELSPDRQKEALAVEYTRLFIAPPKPAAPQESIQRGDGKLWGDSTVKVNKLYTTFGFEVDKEFKDTPDHVSAELAFLVQLSMLELEYTIGGLSDAREGVLQVKKYFLKNHLLSWFPRFKDKIAEHAEIPYYREFSRFAQIFLEDEWENMKDVKEVVSDV